MMFIFPAELGWAVVANHVTCFADTLAVHDAGLGFIEFDRFGVLQGGNVHHFFEFLVKTRTAHIDNISQIIRRYRLFQIFMPFQLKIKSFFGSKEHLGDFTGTPIYQNILNR